MVIVLHFLSLSPLTNKDISYYSTPSPLFITLMFSRYEPLRRLCTLLTSQQQEYYNLQRTVYEQEVSDQLLVYHKPGQGSGLGPGPGPAGPDASQSPTPGQASASGPGPGLGGSGSLASVPMLSWDAWLFGKLRDKHVRDKDEVYQKQQVGRRPLDQ